MIFRSACTPVFMKPTPVVILRSDRSEFTGLPIQFKLNTWKAMANIHWLASSMSEFYMEFDGCRVCGFQANIDCIRFLDSAVLVRENKQGLEMMEFCARSGLVRHPERNRLNFQVKSTVTLTPAFPVDERMYTSCPNGFFFKVDGVNYSNYHECLPHRIKEVVIGECVVMDAWRTHSENVDTLTQFEKQVYSQILSHAKGCDIDWGYGGWNEEMAQ